MSRSDRVFSFDDLWSLDLAIDRFEAGTWFWMSNRAIANFSGEASWHQGGNNGHPVVVQRLNGPTAFVNPRSASSPDGGIEHHPHDRNHDPSCILDRVGYVKVNGFPVPSDALDRKRCAEPADSPLLKQLRTQLGRGA